MNVYHDNLAYNVYDIVRCVDINRNSAIPTLEGFRENVVWDLTHVDEITHKNI